MTCHDHGRVRQLFKRSLGLDGFGVITDDHNRQERNEWTAKTVKGVRPA